MNNRKSIKNIFIVGALIALFTASIITPIDREDRNKIEAQPVNQEVLGVEENIYNPFKNLEIIAESSIVWDIKKQKSLFEKDPDNIIPLASITKMIMAAVSSDTLHPNTEISIDKEFLEAEGDSGLLLNERWLFKDLLEFTLMASSNDGAKAIASIAGSVERGGGNYEEGREEFVRKMNNKMESWNLLNINVKNETGLDKDEFQSGAYGTAREISLLFENLLKEYPEILESTRKNLKTFTSLDGIEHLAKNTNLTISEIPGLIGSKTGFTDLAGGNLAVVFEPVFGRPIVLVVLGSTFEGRFGDIKNLMGATRNYLKTETI